MFEILPELLGVRRRRIEFIGFVIDTEGDCDCFLQFSSVEIIDECNLTWLILVSTADGGDGVCEVCG